MEEGKNESVDAETPVTMERDEKVNTGSPATIEGNNTKACTGSGENPKALIATAITEENEAPPESDLSDEKNPKSLQFKLTVFFLCAVSFIASLDAVIVGACLASIAQDIGGTSNESFWIGTSFLLAQTVTIPIYGTTSEVFGRKWPILIAISIFTLGSILCATAQSVSWLIGARVVQGVGAGGALQLVQVILSDITTMEERGLFMALAAIAWALGTNIGYVVIFLEIFGRCSRTKFL